MRSGKASHGFILDAIARTVEQTELNDGFHRLADERWQSILTTGNTVPWDEMKTYLAARARGEHPPQPPARKLAR